MITITQITSTVCLTVI